MKCRRVGTDLAFNGLDVTSADYEMVNEQGSIGANQSVRHVRVGLTTDLHQGCPIRLP